MFALFAVLSKAFTSAHGKGLCKGDKKSVLGLEMFSTRKLFFSSEGGKEGRLLQRNSEAPIKGTVAI